MKKAKKIITKNNQKKILVIGAGAWGTAIANLIAKNQHQVLLLTNSKQKAQEINKKKVNQKYLPNVKLAKNLSAIFDIDQQVLSDVDFIFISTPSQVVVDFLEKISLIKLKKEAGFVICSKGLDAKKLKFFSEIFSEIFPKKKYAILSGPNFASEVANQSPTITTIASKDKKLANEIIKIVNNDYFFAQYCDDVIASEITAIVKNIMAIGCGIVDSLDLGQNAKSALVKKGIDEILLLSKKFGSKGNISTAAGFADIFLTCSSVKSRNNMLGFEIAKGKSYAEISQKLNKTFEGAVSASLIVKLAKKKKIDLKLCQTIDEILINNFSVQEIREKIIKAIIS
jgi:glycerol-3-phosphate dehydrogenase (NAD(P)+)